MIEAAASLARRPVVWAIGAAWAIALAAQGAGLSGQLHHDVLVHAGWAGAGIFVAVWQVHVAAMMLPSSMPMIELFARVSRGQDRPGAARVAFVGAYLGVWTAFGLAAFTGDIVLHRVVHAFPALEARPHLIAGGVLLGAGLFQFSKLKDACLRECRLPSAYLRRHYRRGVGAAFRLGLRHGFHCLGCCWALMLAMFSLGVVHVAWMAPFGALMVAEKVAPWGDRLVVPAGAALMAAGGLVAVAPG